MNRTTLCIVILITVISRVLTTNDKLLLQMKLNEGVDIAQRTMSIILTNMFAECMDRSMPNQHFLIDDLKNFVNYPSKTTVGFAPKFTNNRKFFANMINTVAFKEMLAHDTEELRNNYVKKTRYCDNVIMDQDILKDLYDREIDPSRI